MGASVSSGVKSSLEIFTVLLGTIGGLWPEQASLVDNSIYDYIVVGGGTAGCVVAGRLAENKTDNVLVLEYGANPPLSAWFPGLFPLIPGSSADYNFTSSRDEYAARGQYNSTMLTAGKMLGGSGSLNHFFYSRGFRKDFDEWAEIVNDNSWSYDQVLPYFIRSETLVDDDILSKYGQYHGINGPMGISRQPDDVAVGKYLEAFAELGYPSVLDLNGNETIGFTQPQLILANGKRQSSAYSYLSPIKDYSNLYVSTNTKVAKIIFENNVAVAVQAVRDGKTYTLRAKKEIIISAGVYNTPQILMLSGIGPQEHLKSLDIEVINDLPVGETFVDQVSVPLVHKVKPHLLPVPNPLSLPWNPTKMSHPIMEGSVALNKSQSYPDYRTFNLLLQHDTPLLTVICNKIFGLRKDICEDWQDLVSKRESLYNILYDAQPKSTGSIRLKSVDPFDDPIITTGYFTNEEDMQNIIKYISHFIAVGNTRYFKEIGAELVGLDLPECADKEKDSYDFWKCYVLNRAHSNYQQASTCPMGKVVDSTLKVKGMNKLRVVDASVMPTITRGAPYAAVIMVAEKASDMIKSDNSV